jgi:ferredoxin
MVPGFQKTHLHKYHPTQKEFGRLLKAIYGKVKPALTIADAIVGMEGNGPTAGEPTHLNFLAAADSGPALDLTLCHILRIRPKLVSYLDGSSASDRESIEILGCDLKDVSPRSFRLPNTVYPRLIPGRLAKALGRLLWIRPVVSDACTRCGRCVRSCPAEALSMPPDGPPRLDAVRCIGCCCCHEICPSNAITMAMSPVLRFIRKGKLP